MALVILHVFGKFWHENEVFACLIHGTDNICIRDFY
jgi:hypothetical protein